jgi:hypothetical protein
MRLFVGDIAPTILISCSLPSSHLIRRGETGRFFYAPTLAAADNLFRGVVQGLYGHRFPTGSAGSSKVEWLQRLKADGVFMIDVVPHSINKLSCPERRQLLREHSRSAVNRMGKMAPRGIVVCHNPTFRRDAVSYFKAPGFRCCMRIPSPSGSEHAR